MNIGIFTYGTRGDVQPYIALALGLKSKGHTVLLGAPQNFRELAEGYGVDFHPLFGNAEEMMNSPDGQAVLKTENPIKLMKYFFKALNDIKTPLRQSYIDGISKVDVIMANSITLPIVSAIAEKQHKKMALSYFMPPVVITADFPLGDFDFFNFAWYNRLTYKIAHTFYWKFVKAETNEWRQQLGLPALKQNLLYYIEAQKPLDLYCFSPALILRPNDWPAHHKITGFLTVPGNLQQTGAAYAVPVELSNWLNEGEKPIYIGFGSNGVGNTQKFVEILSNVLSSTNHRILFCTGWSQFTNLPVHKNLFVTKYVNHNAVLPACKLGVFHGGAGTLAAMLRNNLPVIIISFYTDQPTWGKIIERKKLGAHVPVKKLTAGKLIAAIKQVQSPAIKTNVERIGEQLRNENGLETAVREMEAYFGC